MTAPRYWRIHVTANNEPSGWRSVQIAELEFRATVGGAALTGTWTATADAGTGFELANIHDADFATAYASAGGFGAVDTYINLDLGVGVTSPVLQVAIAPREAQHTYAPKTFSLDFSNDGSLWFTIATFSNIPVGDYADDTYTLFAPPGPGLYDSRMSEYLVEGRPPGVYDSRMSEYLVEGPSKTALVSRMSEYIVVGAPPRRLGPLVG